MLPNELIICVFRYLELVESFQSFFDCNSRFRKSVKRYVPCDRRALDFDIERYSTLHSWYKHLNFDDGGVIFYQVPLKGEQARYNFDPCVFDRHGIHWHFWCETLMSLTDKRIKQIIEKYPIKLNPLFHPLEQWFRICFENVPDFIRQYHPTQFEALKTTLFSRPFNSFFEASEFCTDDDRATLELIRGNERKRLRDIIQGAAGQIWKEIQALEDVNILEITYENRRLDL